MSSEIYFPTVTSNSLDASKFPSMSNEQQCTIDLPVLKLCRICGKSDNGKEMVPIFPIDIYQYDLFQNLSVIIEKYLPIQVSIQDTLPLSLCYQCANVLVSWRDFVQTCIKTDQIFQYELQLKTTDNHYSLNSIQPLKPSIHSDGDAQIDRSFQYDSQQYCNDNTVVLSGDTSQSSFYGLLSETQSSSQKQIVQEYESMTSAECEKIKNLESLEDRLNSLVTVLTSHVDEHHDTKEGSVCSDRSFTSSYKSETKRRSLMCHLCKLVFKSNRCLILHMNCHQKCRFCNRKFRSVDDVMSHIEVDHPNSAEDKPSFIKHKDKVINYNEIEKVEVVIDGTKYYKCQVCGKNLQRLYSYLTHASIHTGEKEYICHLCGKQFRLSTTLRVHMKYTHEGIKDAACELCGKQFATRKNMLQHQRIHTGERPYQCGECGKSFKQSASLYIHKRTHTDVFPFECSQCNTRYRIKSQLKYHMIKHTGENPFPCDVCGKACATMSHLNYHKKCAHVKGRPFRCTQCDKAFRQKKYLRQHIKCSHKAST